MAQTQIHNQILNSMNINQQNYTSDVCYFYELVKILGDEADEFDYKKEMHPCIYNSETFEKFVSINFFVLKKVPESMITQTMIDTVIQNYPRSFDFLCECNIDVDEQMCKDILSVTCAFGSYDNEVYNQIIEYFPHLSEYFYALNQTNETDEMEQDDPESVEVYNMQIDQMYERYRSKDDKEAFEGCLSQFVNSHTVNYEEDKSCSVCFDSFHSIVKLDCGHEFCEDCVCSWIKTRDEDTRLSKNCPMCRRHIQL